MATETDSPDDADTAAKRRSVTGREPDSSASTDSATDNELPRDVLIVISKLKAYIRARSGMNTSDAVTSVLSDHLRKLCAEAIRNAAKDGRKTVLDRDFLPLI